MNLQDFKKLKLHTLLLKSLKEAELNDFYSQSVYGVEKKEKASELFLRTSNCDFAISLPSSNGCSSFRFGSISAEIKHGNFTVSRLGIDFADSDLKDYILDLFYSEEYALGKYIKEGGLHWKNLEGQ